MTTWLDEYCHDCDAALLAAAAGVFRMALGGGGAGGRERGGGGSGGRDDGMRILRELDVNVPARALPSTVDSSGSFGSSASYGSSVSVEP